MAATTRALRLADVNHYYTRVWEEQLLKKCQLAKISQVPNFTFKRKKKLYLKLLTFFPIGADLWKLFLNDMVLITF